ncbi:n-methyltryptophan oxidase [Stylonychia lemnae]|uniref:N-methyltryptophan oxidase n=1 Tax=Stylonychia lemnae TaxID=5949 RepID=A0A078B8P8_STYLE|nr:n-methyltryptophan oxidase [Stylonychia lemnae]|eukprot:CDW89687.1 n-methyltryptophan oxidase [Stylonychia lemnae]
MEKQTVDCDVIVVGLGCFGLGATYYMSKMGLKVIGFDQAHKPGAIGSGSVGYGRIWRYLHAEDRYCQMQKEAEEIFKEVENKTGKEILHGGGLLYMKKKDHPELNELQKYGERLTAAQIRERYPALKVPDYLEGVFTKDAGVVRVKESLTLFKEQSENQGAILKYDTTVSHIDHQNSIVTLENGEKFRAKNVVVTCGATTDQFYQQKDQFKARKQLINCFYLSDNVNLPTAFLMEDLEEAGGIMVFGTIDGENFSTYKVGNECDDIDPHLISCLDLLLFNEPRR